MRPAALAAGWAFRSAAAATLVRWSVVVRGKAERAEAHPARSRGLMASVAGSSGIWLPSKRHLVKQPSVAREVLARAQSLQSSSRYVACVRHHWAVKFASCGVTLARGRTDRRWRSRRSPPAVLRCPVTGSASKARSAP